MEAYQVIAQVCAHVTQTNMDAAAELLKQEYPFEPITKSSRQYTPKQMTKIFIRDGFIDRYRGNKLIFPPTLRILSHYFHNEFPYHKNGKMSEGHIAYWELFPTIDHVEPVARGGKDTQENWVCCSMLTNSIKANWRLADIGWQLLPCGDFASWDGMLHWYLDQYKKMPHLASQPYFKTWYNAAMQNLP